MEITYRKYVQQIPNTRNSCPNFVMIQPKVIFDTMENKRKCEEWCWEQMVENIWKNWCSSRILELTHSMLFNGNSIMKNKTRDLRCSSRANPLHFKGNYVLHSAFHTTSKCTKNCDIETLSTMFTPPIEGRSKL